MSHNTRASDPFAAPYEDLQAAATPAGTLSTGNPAASRAPPTLGAGSYRTGTSAGRKTPWYLKTFWIAVLVIALLLALGLGIGLGVGLGTRNNQANLNKSELAQAGSQSTVTSYSTYESIVTAGDNTTIVPVIATQTKSRSASIVIETIGGSTVTMLQPETQGAGSGVIVTVSETQPPNTRTNIVYVTTFPSTQTVTTTLAGGVGETVFRTVTIRRTITAAPTAPP